MKAPGEGGDDRGEGVQEGDAPGGGRPGPTPARAGPASPPQEGSGVVPGAQPEGGGAPPGTAGHGPSEGDASDALRNFLSGAGESWTVEVVGRGRTGTLPDVGAPLLLLRFRPALPGPGESGGTDSAPAPPPDHLAVGRRLEDLPDEVLDVLLSDARSRHSVSK